MNQQPTTINHQLAKGELLYGRQPVLESLLARRRTVHELCILRSAKPSRELDSIQAEARNKKIPVSKIDRKELDTMTDNANHQGVAIKCSPYAYLSQDDLLGMLKKKKHAPLALVLDHIQDPQNFGSLLRSADAVNADAVVIPAHKAAGVTPAAVRASAGAAEHLKVCRVNNIVDTMQELKELDIRCVGLEPLDKAKPYDKADLTGPIALVVGSESKGICPRVRNTCDLMIRLPQLGKVTSLNAATAGAIALFEILRQR